MILQGNLELSHSMVHYLLTIYKLKKTRGYARTTDIAADLGLTKGSVSTSLNALKRKGFVEEDEDNSLFFVLSEKGYVEINKILSSKILLFHFFRDFIGVDEKIAEQDSCRIEHLISMETSKKLFKFMKDLSCCCSENRSLDMEGKSLKTSLDLCLFNSAEDFISHQKLSEEV